VLAAGRGVAESSGAFLGTHGGSARTVERASDLPGAEDDGGFALQATETVVVPDARSPVAACRDRNDVASCIALSIAVRKAGALLKIYLVAGEGAAAVFRVKDNITLYGVSDLEITGIPTFFGTKPVLEQRMPDQRNILQYWLFHLIDVRNVKLRNLVLDGRDLQAGRGIGVCGLKASVEGVVLEQLQMRNFIYFNVLVGNSITKDQLAQVAALPAPATGPLTPQQRLITGLRADRPAGCGGDVHDLVFRGNVVQMKSVGFYLVPYSALTSASVPVQVPVASGNTSVPAWYGEERAHSKRVSGIQIVDNKFLNALPNVSQAVIDANGYHSAIKLHHAFGTVIKGNVVEATNAPRLFASGAAINLAAGMFDVKVEKNRILFPADRRDYPHGIGVDATYLAHPLYGFGDKQIFGPGEGLDIRDNALQGAKIRFMDCCVQGGADEPDFRPYCAQRDDLVGRGLFDERINLKGNSENGVPGRDAALIWRTSVNERPWVDGQYATRCREQLRVTFK
jgi:hypothetical protein